MGKGTTRSLIQTTLMAWLTTIALTTTSYAQITLKRGGTAELGSVYWMRSCLSILDDFESIALTSGPPGLSLSLRKQDVKPVQSDCSSLIPGAIVVIAASQDAPLGAVTVTFKVNYRTKTGRKEQSNHSRNLSITP